MANKVTPGGTARVSLKGVAWWARVVATVALPLLLVPLNLRWTVVHNLSFYEVEFERYRIERVTGFTASELLGAARALMAYFDGDQEPFSYLLGDGGEIYSAREVAHLRDVKGLLRLADAVGWTAALALALTTYVQRRLRSEAWLMAIGRSLSGGALATLGLLGGLAVLSLADFSEAFLQFHRIFFRNDLWQLDPRTDNLIRMFPEGFFFDATLLIAASTAAEALLLLALGIFLRARAKRL